MRYLILTVLLSILFTANSVFAQMRQNPGKQTLPHLSFSDSLITQLPSIVKNELRFLSGQKINGMPVYNPGNVDAKMKFWWPSTDYQYNMPNPLFKKEKSLKKNSKPKNKR